MNALYANTTGMNNTAVGFGVDVMANNLSNATALGYNAKVNATNKIRLGDVNVTVIEGQVPFSFVSDARFKYNVKEDVPGLAFITKLKPVTYYMDNKKFDEFLRAGKPNAEEKFRTEVTADTVLHTGFLAQDVERIAKELDYQFDGVHAPTNEKDNYSIAYSQFIMPLVKAVQEQQQ